MRTVDWIKALHSAAMAVLGIALVVAASRRRKRENRSIRQVAAWLGAEVRPPPAVPLDAHSALALSVRGHDVELQIPNESIVHGPPQRRLFLWVAAAKDVLPDLSRARAALPIGAYIVGSFVADHERLKLEVVLPQEVTAMDPAALRATIDGLVAAALGLVP